MKASLLEETCQIANRPNPGRTPTLPDSFGLVRLLSLLQSASMLTQGMQRASEWGIAGGIGYNRQPARLIHSRIYARLRIRPGEPSADVRRRPARRASLILITRALHPQTSTNVRPQPAHPGVHLGVSATGFGSIPPRHNSQKCARMRDCGCGSNPAEGLERRPRAPKQLLQTFGAMVFRVNFAGGELASASLS